MRPATWHRPGTAAGLLPVLLGWICGTALQLMQPALWPWWPYAALVLVGVVVGLAIALAWRNAGRLLRNTCLLLAIGALAFGQVGLRAVVFQARALLPALEGRDLLLTGVVATMPQRGANGLRFQLQVESASADGSAVALPPRIQLGWYGGHGGDADASAGQIPRSGPANAGACRCV